VALVAAAFKCASLVSSNSSVTNPVASSSDRIASIVTRKLSPGALAQGSGYQDVAALPAAISEVCLGQDRESEYRLGGIFRLNRVNDRRTGTGGTFVSAFIFLIYSRETQAPHHIQDIEVRDRGHLWQGNCTLAPDRRMTDPTVSTPLITNDTVVMGLLAVALGLVFWTSSRPDGFFKRFYTYVPALLLCYFIPALLNSTGVIDGSASGLYPMARDYLLPTALVLLTLSIDFDGIRQMGPKAIIMFLVGTLGVMLGAVFAFGLFEIISPQTVEGETWRGMTTIAGSWIGGGANQAAMKEVFEVDSNLFGQFVAVDVLVGNVWMAIILFLAGRADAFDRWTGADTRAIDDMKRRVEAFQAQHSRIPQLPDLMVILAIGLGATGLSHAMGEPLAIWIGENAPVLARYSLTSSFFWVVVFATTIGLLLSLTRARNLEGAGASRIGSAALYVLVATIGMHMDLGALFDRPRLFALGFVWIAVHAIIMLTIAKWIRAPLFFMAVGSQANIGGAASAPVVASAFHPSLAPVGVLMAVLGYALGTYGAYLTGLMLQAMAG
jgi:uncharacterized membrane protein